MRLLLVPLIMSSFSKYETAYQKRKGE